MLPILPVENTVFFPQAEVTLALRGQAEVAAVDAALARDDLSLAALTVKRPLEAFAALTADDLYHVGVRLTLKQVTREGLEATARAVAGERIRLMGDFLREPVPMGTFVPLGDATDDGREADVLAHEIDAMVRSLGHGAAAARPVSAGAGLGDVHRLAWLLGLGVERAQALLEAPRRIDALRLLHHWLAHELRAPDLMRGAALATS